MNWTAQEKKWIQNLLGKIEAMPELAAFTEVLGQAFSVDSQFFRAHGDANHYAMTVWANGQQYYSIAIFDNLVNIKLNPDSEDLFERVIAHELAHVFDAYMHQHDRSRSSSDSHFIELAGFKETAPGVWIHPLAENKNFKSESERYLNLFYAGKFAEARAAQDRIFSVTELPSRRSFVVPPYSSGHFITA